MRKLTENSLQRELRSMKEREIEESFLIKQEPFKDRATRIFCLFYLKVEKILHTLNLFS